MPPAVVGLFEIRTCVAPTTSLGVIATRSAFVAARPSSMTNDPSGGIPETNNAVASVAQPPATLICDACHTPNVARGSGTTGTWVGFQAAGKQSGPLHVCSPVATSCEG